MTLSSHAASLVEKHAQLDEKIVVESQRPMPDDVLLRTWKKEKLRIKQEINHLTQH